MYERARKIVLKRILHVFGQLICLWTPLVFLGGCELSLVETTGVVIRVADATTDQPIEGANVTVGGIIYYGRRSYHHIPTRCAPTDAAGRTFVPVVRTNQAPVEVVMDLVITSGQQSVVVAVPRISGAEEVVGDVAVRVMESSAPVPNVSIPAPIPGSVGSVEVNGYVEVVAFCRCSDGIALLSLTPRNSWGAYVDTVSLDIVPEGFEVHTRDGIAGNGSFLVDCPVPLDSLCVSADRIVVAVMRMFDSLSCDPVESCFRTNSFCVDLDGEVVPCADE